MQEAIAAASVLSMGLSCEADYNRRARTGKRPAARRKRLDAFRW